MAIVTGNFTLHPQDGWVQVATSATSFERLSKTPHHIPVFLAFGSSAPSLTAASASGTITFAGGVPTATQTVVIGTETYTFVASRSAAFQVTIGADAPTTAANFATAVNTDSTLVNAVAASGVVTLYSKVPGSAGNAIGTTTSATHVTAGAATLAGGTDLNSGFRWDCGEIFFECAVSVKTWARIRNESNGDVHISVFTD